MPGLGHGCFITQGGDGATGYDALDIRRAATATLQEGVVDSGSYAVTQRALGATMSVDIAASTGGGAYVQGDSVTLQGLYYVAPHSALVNEGVSTAHSTNPRIDRVVLQIEDDLHDASTQNRAQVRVLTGTATSGATLNNLNGAPSVPSSALLLADVLVPAASSSVLSTNIRDRRKWARGAYCRIVRNANAAGSGAPSASYTTSSTTMVLIDSTNIAPRIECSGVPLRVTLTGVWTTFGAGGFWDMPFAPQIDGVGVDGMPSVGASHTNGALRVTMPSAGHLVTPGLAWTFVPTAGSHVIAPAWATPNSGGPVLLYANATRPIVWTVEELVRQNSANNATSG